MKSLFLTAGAVALALCASSASAQEVINLSAGFLPDPIETSVVSGGGNDASDIGGSCVGMIADSPDVVVNFDSNGGTLSFSHVSGGDTSLVINAPNGRYYCNDDANGLNPVVTFGSAQSGQYDVWVGAVGSPAGGTLQISESPL
ncbi:hypothetical protein [Brevundimonas bacteroides]|uniref:hypothetical protein n=1 Tax=Brevundimonas bacteroides TaxID=74311 RepID=UPI000496FAF0|nr:hypothetical protein [Brevundimonas bacteroides]